MLYSEKEKNYLCIMFYKEVIKKYYTFDTVFSLRNLNSLNSRYRFYEKLETNRTITAIIAMLYRENYLYFTRKFDGYDYGITRKYINTIKDYNARYIIK